MKSYPIQINERHPDVVFLPYTFPEVRQLQHISFGASVAACKVETDYLSDSIITIGANVAKQIHLPFAADIHVFIQEDTIMLGPLIGIFTAGFTESALRPIGERSLFFANLLTATAANKAYMFVFGSHHIHWDEGTVTGYFYNNERWVQHEVPLPHVVYDRLPNRKTENHRAIARVKTRLQREYLIPWFNPGFFNKWDIYQLLQREEEALPYLPETERFTSFGQIELLLAKYGHVYVKPMNGSLGNSIYQIRYAFEENVYYCRFRDENGNKLRKYQALEYLVNHLLRHHELDKFIVQQGISLYRLNGQPVDFRVHTNKNRSGIWQLTAIAAKVAGQGSMTTHINNGGDVLTLEELFPDPQQRDEVQTKITDAVLLLSGCIDRQVDGCIGEIGFDIGLDKNGKVWLFEANSKPGRSIFEHPKLQESDRLTKELFLEYALHLTEKSLFSPEELFQ
ncbi:YheC/YheD family endospore coat-associated protein [Ectobacillus ponti]|uniref:YheC/YheD family protein n=1 Tax=Ectobacillus ponti TaxID=2961894 RepID=A0AA41XA16_9BACI|nr:YheC/YheD family protein [Ectobacillus ponti]MCP8968176.1 YheC/YheD family protein [Ectobacillus ponti]